ncbi:Serine/threonine-protein kinase Nek6 [Stylophora pistillata]|uniref:Serine/threonine-protein kinase Nek6 n=1 Tax=Stylophora pistillata TaxID=50429 RepID=A0A2B4RPB5_STYPI|nr:Serine/threonine-protein kinase Nek6 [Stylophora pistillata]
MAFLIVCLFSFQGGGYLTGAGAQEENLFRRTNYVQHLADPDKEFDPKRKWKYRIPEFSCIYSKNVFIIRASEAEGYMFLAHPVPMSFLALPAYPNPALTKDKKTLIPVIAENTKRKIRCMLSAGLYYAHDSLVLSALGCGAFRNPARHMAQLFKEVLSEGEFANRYKHISFAILDDHNARGEGNFKPFLEKGTNALIDLEEKFLRDLQQAPSRVHNALRNVGKFPLIITTNMDELVERFLWKTGNGGEKLRLDQSWPDLRRDVIIKCLGDGGFTVRPLGAEPEVSSLLGMVTGQYQLALLIGVYAEEKVQRTLDAMKGRRDNLIKLITESHTSVTALFFYHGVKKEIEGWKQIEKIPPPSEEETQKILQKCKISISKYAKAILLCKSFMRSNSSLEILIVGDEETYQVQEVEKETFALIRLKGGADEAICYAETASSPEDRKFAAQLININGDEVLNKPKVYERSRSNAWNNEDSILKLATAIMRENAQMKEKCNIDAIEKKDLEALETLTRVSQKVISKLDPGYLEPLGEGSFGQVFRAKKDGHEVAVKILKNIENRKQIEDFEREVDTLREAKHPKLVKVLDWIFIPNQLAIVMEFMAAGDLKAYLEKYYGTGQGIDFTIRFIEDIGSAIEHLHSLNIMHRDVKPENIFLSADHTVLKFVDFGLPRATEGTRQTKTQIGSYRYMAPEVVTTGGRYSKKADATKADATEADVHSFGLCLIEVLSGKEVYDNILQHETVFNKKMAGENPTIPDISVEEFGEELALKLKEIVDECLRPEKSRPEMHFVLNILRGKITTRTNTVELYCVGTGTGTTAVLHGQPSSSAIVFHRGKPLLMVDVGAGVVKACRERLAYNEFPRNVFITHNHLDHAGELPLLFAFESMRRYLAREPRLRVLSGPEVQHKLKIHRLDEMLSLYTPEQAADWLACEQNGGPTYLDDDKQFSIKTYRTLHSEICYGFVLYFKEEPILGYCVDSGFKEDVFEFFFQASTVIVDARDNGTKEHASFAEVVEYVTKIQPSDTKVYVTGYGIDAEYPDQGLPGLEQLRADQYITLWDEENDRNT